jgi:hypothetical protein
MEDFREDLGGVHVRAGRLVAPHGPLTSPDGGGVARASGEPTSRRSLDVNRRASGR